MSRFCLFDWIESPMVVPLLLLLPVVAAAALHG
jgi:hypothetical protein